MTIFNGDPEWSRHLEKFHDDLRAASDAPLVLPPLAPWVGNYHATHISRHVWEWAVHEQAEQLQGQPDTVPVRRSPTDWDGLRAAARSGRPLRFHAAEMTENGVTLISGPVALAVPDWPDNGSALATPE